MKSLERSELMAVMTGGFVTIAGGVMVVYIGILAPRFPDIAGHLIAASVMGAPAGLVMSKLMLPETEQSLTAGTVRLEVERPWSNVIDAAAEGATTGLTLALNVAAMLLAFMGLLVSDQRRPGLGRRPHRRPRSSGSKAGYSGGPPWPLAWGWVWNGPRRGRGRRRLDRNQDRCQRVRGVHQDGRDDRRAVAS
jgi:hypothetical protein